MWPIKNTIVIEIVRTLGMTGKLTDEHIPKIPGTPSRYKMQKLHFTKLFFSFGEYHQCDWKISLKRGCKNIDITYNAQNI